MAKEQKTNVMRLIERANIKYNHFSYDADPTLSGAEIAERLGEKPEKVFKTLVTVGKSGEHYVFAVPVCRTLNLKKAAKAIGEKAVSMLPMKELLPLTGYVHGGCSPIGMKKVFRTVFDKSAEGFDRIFFSAGKVGAQVEVSPGDAEKLINIEYADITDEEEGQ